LAAHPGGAGAGSGRESFAGLVRAWRPAVLPALGGSAAAWFLVSPLVGSSLSFQAEWWAHRDSQRAFSLHDRAVALAPGYAWLHERRAKALWRAADRQSTAAGSRDLLLASREGVETACRLEPLSARLHADRARILFDLARQGWGEAEAALAAFDRSLALDRCDWLVLADACRAASTLGRLAECDRYLAVGLAEQPRLGPLLAECGALELARGRLAGAERRLREALGAEWFGERERFDRAALLLGLVLLRTGRAEESARQARAVIDRRDWAPAWLLYAHCREQSGNRKEALEAFRRVLDRRPGHEEARAGAARLAGEQGRRPD
jgi:tetratricopeptide (TPR) repeat protein